MGNIEDRYPICPEEDDLYRPRVEEILGIKMDNATFEKVAWYIAEEWLDHVEEGPPEHRAKWQKVKERNWQYISYLLRDDVDRAKAGNPYPRPQTDRLKRVWKAAQSIYFLNDPNGFLGPSMYEMLYVGQAIVFADDLGVDTGFDADTIAKLNRCAIDQHSHIIDEAFDQWVADGGLYSMYTHRGSDYVSDTYLKEVGNNEEH